MPASVKGGQVTVEWQPSKTREGEVIRAALSKSQAFEQLAKMLSDLYVLPRNTKLVFRDCDTVNCWYNPSDGSVTMCYDMILYVLRLMQQHEGSTASTPVSKPSSAPQGAASLLVGSWHLVQSSADMHADGISVFRSDGTFHSQKVISVQGLSTNVTVVGRWTATAGPEGSLELVTAPDDWTPKKFA
ncbi:DUF4344 domain-containing metallopeptidase [Methylobacterium sp. P31]